MLHAVQDIGDPTTFTTAGDARRVDKPWGWEIHWTPDDRPYVGKVLHVTAGKRLSLQVHDEKLESWFLMSGRAKVVWDDGTGELAETELMPGLGYSCAIGQRHRLVGITDCDILEVSTPEIGTTFRLEDDFARPDETEAVRNAPGRGWGEGQPAAADGIATPIRPPRVPGPGFTPREAGVAEPGTR